jgi:hypothetical protein
MEEGGFGGTITTTTTSTSNQGTTNPCSRMEERTVVGEYL